MSTWRFPQIKCYQQGIPRYHHGSDLFKQFRNLPVIQIADIATHKEDDPMGRFFGNLRQCIEKISCNRPEDRKSTRLNSSHVAISYAVFCLKKKEKQL